MTSYYVLIIVCLLSACRNCDDVITEPWGINFSILHEDTRTDIFYHDEVRYSLDSLRIYSWYEEDNDTFATPFYVNNYIFLEDNYVELEKPVERKFLIYLRHDDLDTLTLRYTVYQVGKCNQGVYGDFIAYYNGVQYNTYIDEQTYHFDFLKKP